MIYENHTQDDDINHYTTDAKLIEAQAVALYYVRQLDCSLTLIYNMLGKSMLTQGNCIVLYFHLSSGFNAVILNNICLCRT